jgi:hypothetical protein
MVIEGVVQISDYLRPENRAEKKASRDQEGEHFGKNGDNFG